jgi:hypothetical protein
MDADPDVGMPVPEAQRYFKELIGGVVSMLVFSV